MESKILLNRKCVNILGMEGGESKWHNEKEEDEEGAAGRDKGKVSERKANIENWKVVRKRILTYKHSTAPFHRKFEGMLVITFAFLLFFTKIYVYFIHCTLSVHTSTIYISLFKWLLSKRIKMFVHDFSLRWYLFCQFLTFEIKVVIHTYSLTHSYVFFDVVVCISWQWSI